MPLTLTSRAFDSGGRLPARNAGPAGRSPPLTWSGVPPGTASLALVVTDPDVLVAGRPAQYTHWLLTNIDPASTGLDEGQRFIGVKGAAIHGSTSSRARASYVGPTPPPGAPAHHYIFTLLALSEAPPRTEAGTITRSRLNAWIERKGALLDSATLTALYSTPSKV